MDIRAHQLLVFKLDALQFALRLAVVERIERAVEITPLPKLPKNVLGIVNLKGQIVPVFNVRREFRLPERDVEPWDHFIFARTARRAVALAVDSVGEIIEQHAGEVVAANALFPDLEYWEGVAKLEDGLVLIHDLDRFLSVPEEKALEEAIKRYD